MTYNEILNSEAPIGDLSLSTAERKALDIIGDLTDRKGLKHEWENIDEDIQDEIFQLWVGIIARDAVAEVNAADELELLETKQQHLFEKWSEFQHQELGVEDDIDTLVQETVHLMFPDLNKDAFTYRTSGWKCENPDKNPFPLCVYNHEDDPCLDDCVFCHDPYERK